MNETIVKQSAGPQNAGSFKNLSKVLILTARWIAWLLNFFQSFWRTFVPYYLPIELNVFRVILMETHCRFTTMSVIFATTRLKIHMSSQGKADNIEF